MIGMRAHVVLAAALAACDAGGTQGTVDAPAIPSDGPGADAEPGCHTVIALKNMFVGHVGGNGGGKGPVLQCNDNFGERIVGVALQMSDQATVFGGRSAMGIRIACATVTIAPDGTPLVGAVETQEVSGTGTSGWSPATWTAIQQCPPGSVLTGMATHTGTNMNLFVDASILCSPLAANAAPGAPQTIHITGSLTNTTNPVQAQCAPTDVVSALGIWDGAGLDAVDVDCSPSACR